MLNRRRDREKAKAGRSRRSIVWQDTRQLLALVVVAVMVAGGLLVHVEAAAGDLDTTFSRDGKQTTNMGACIR
jgi:hypothetical protein